MLFSQKRSHFEHQTRTNHHQPLTITVLFWQGLHFHSCQQHSFPACLQGLMVLCSIAGRIHWWIRHGRVAIGHRHRDHGLEIRLWEKTSNSVLYYILYSTCVWFLYVFVYNDFDFCNLVSSFKAICFTGARCATSNKSILPAERTAPPWRGILSLLGCWSFWNLNCEPRFKTLSPHI